jgi:hypothetical protein
MRLRRQTHGSAYTLRHVAGGFEALAALLQPPEGHGHGQRSSGAATNTAAADSGAAGTDGRDAPSPASSSSSVSGEASSAAFMDALLHAGRLAQLARYALDSEHDLPSLAACLVAISRLPARARAEELASPFFLQLCKPGYMFSFEEECPAVLGAVLHAMAKIKPWRSMVEERTALNKVRTLRYRWRGGGVLRSPERHDAGVCRAGRGPTYR